MPKVSLYELLRVDAGASDKEIRKAFLILAKKVHPDKLKREGKDEDSNEAFRALRRAYDILMDPERRKRYDRTGIVDDGDSQAFADAYERFRGIKVTKEDIDRVEKEYRESSDEKADLLEFFRSNEGDVRSVLAYIPASTNDDIPRFIEIWKQELENNSLPKKFKKEFMKASKEILTLEQLDEQGKDLNDDDDDDDDEEEEEEEEESEQDFIDNTEYSEDEMEEEEEEEAKVLVKQANTASKKAPPLQPKNDDEAALFAAILGNQKARQQGIVNAAAKHTKHSKKG